MDNKKPYATWCEIDLTAVRYNLLKCRELVKNTKVCYVVKADAYGFGLERMINTAEQLGIIFMYGVADISEGIKLRSLGVNKPILVFRNPFAFQLGDFYKHDLTMSLTEFSVFKAMKDISRNFKKKLSAHLKIDSGLGRLGFRFSDQKKLIQFLKKAEPYLQICGAYTHFSDSFQNNPDNNRTALKFFLQYTNFLEKNKIKVPVKHAASSSAALFYPESRLDMVRIGGAVYNKLTPDFQPVFSLKSRVGLIKKIKKGQTLGYGLLYKAKADERIVTVPAGHADGIPAFLSCEKGNILIRGQRLPIVGRISMDQIMAAARANMKTPLAIGDEVVIAGKQGFKEIALTEIYNSLGHWNIIPEAMNRRVPRIYMENNRVKHIDERLSW